MSKISLYDISGRLVYVVKGPKIAEGVLSIGVSSFVSGIYTLVFDSENGQGFKRIAIQK